MIIFVPGAFRVARDLAHWPPRLADLDARIINLPGHQWRGEHTIAAYAEALAEQIPSDAVLVGESLGGLVALALADRVRKVVAVDPPMTTMKLWHLHQITRGLFVRFPADPHLRAVARSIFGLSETGLEERDYRSLLSPGAHVITGSIPPGEPRPYDLTPCMIDEGDIALMETRGLVVHRVDGVGHGVLHPEYADRVEAVLRGIVAQDPASTV